VYTHIFVHQQMLWIMCGVTDELEEEDTQSQALQRHPMGEEKCREG